MSERSQVAALALYFLRAFAAMILAALSAVAIAAASYPDRVTTDAALDMLPEVLIGSFIVAALLSLVHVAGRR